jgi:hypothetical protein
MPVAATRPGTKRLSEVARHVVKPSGIAATGWPAVEATCRTKLGIAFDEWQAGAGRLILAKRDNGKLAATIGGVGMSLPRQVGKTYLLAGLLFGLCINEPGLLVIWTAHHARTHGETFLSMQAFAKRSKAAPYIDQVYTGSGDEEIRFRNGSRILFGARERGFGRGIPGVDVLVMDEAQILSDKALENMLATLNTSQFGLHLYIGTPPKPDDNSEAFARMRTEAIAGESEDLVWIECGADEDAKPTDRQQWAKANPSYPHRTPAESIERLRRKLLEDGFLREGLGIWQTISGGLITSDMWARLVDPQSTPTDPVAFGVYANKMQTNAAIGVAAHRPDGKIHVGIVPAVRGSELDSLPGVGWIPARMAELQEQWKPCALVVDGYSAAATLVSPMQELGLEVEVTNATDFARACQSFYTGVVEDGIRHRGAGPLARAVTAAKKRDLSDGWAWDRKDGSSDITQLNAVTLALHGLVNHPPQISVYASEELLVL